jgi:hypothetical protein
MLGYYYRRHVLSSAKEIGNVLSGGVFGNAGVARRL